MTLFAARLASAFNASKLCIQVLRLVSNGLERHQACRLVYEAPSNSNNPNCERQAQMHAGVTLTPRLSNLTSVVVVPKEGAGFQSLISLRP